jgi:hypothetical protein
LLSGRVWLFSASWHYQVLLTSYSRSTVVCIRQRTSSDSNSITRSARENEQLYPIYHKNAIMILPTNDDADPWINSSILIIHEFTCSLSCNHHIVMIVCKMDSDFDATTLI